MKNKISLLCSILCIFAPSFLGAAPSSEVNSYIEGVYDALPTIIIACKEKKTYNTARTYISLEMLLRSCAQSSKFPISSPAKKTCNILSNSNMNQMKLSCSIKEVEKRYSEDDLVPHYKSFLSKNPKCYDSLSCLNAFMNNFALENVKKFDCESKHKLAYYILCRTADPNWSNKDYT